jgi:alkanesulfonate monooxygenase SsuD/methylene tetrahydromethanopterin reductase-like flavin-dependent oxidoreductase (luciferase family)
MEFGIQFFPDVAPNQKSAQQYFADALDLVELAEQVGFTHARIVEHYFHSYGGYSPNPLVFLSAASQRTRRMRLVTGAILPVFNHPLKIAGEIGMLDAISNGRLDVGFARAFLPHEFRRFGISPNESNERYREGIEQVELLLTQESVTHHGKYHRIDNTTSLPRPTQAPRPKFYVAALHTPETFEFAGRKGYSIMAIPLGGGKMRDLIGIYRKAWRAAGHPGNGEVMLAFHMFCQRDGEAARATARAPFENYLNSLVDAASDWLTGATSNDYPNYDKVIAKLKGETMDSMIASNAAWIGSPAEIIQSVSNLIAACGEFEHASLQVNFNLLPREAAIQSLRLFAQEVMPSFAAVPAPLRQADDGATDDTQVTELKPPSTTRMTPVTLLLP